MSRFDTIAWRGVMSGDNPEGLDLTQIRQFLGDAEELALDLGTWAGISVPIAIVNDDCTIRHLWVGVQRRCWLRRGQAGAVRTRAAPLAFIDREETPPASSRP